MIKPSKNEPKSGMDGFTPSEKSGMKTTIKKQTYFPRQKKPVTILKQTKNSSRKKANAASAPIGKTAAPFHPRKVA